MLYSDAFLTLSPNVRDRDFLVGDLHGQGALLDHGLALVNFDPAVDRLIALGDLIVAGHSVLAQQRPVAVANFLWIETGGYLDEGRLTLVDIQNNQYWQVGHSKHGARAIRRHPQALPKPITVDERWRPSAEEIRLAQEQERDHLNKLLWWM